MSILIIAEHDQQHLRASTLSTITAACRLDKPIHVLVAGHHVQNIAETLSKTAGVTQVLLADHAAYAYPLAESLAPLIVHCAEQDEYSHFMAPATTFGKNILPYAASYFGVSPISDIIEVVDLCTYRRPIYAGNAIATVRAEGQKQAITVRVTAFEPALQVADAAAPIKIITFVADNRHSRFISLEQQAKDRPELTSARIVISGGRGLETQENFALLADIAQHLGAAVGASRAAVDAGLAPNDCQVGQTGQMVAPELYIAVGISGAIQHLAGMKDSKIIVAINKDPEAPIFQIADYRLVADLETILPQWKQMLSEL